MKYYLTSVILFVSLTLDSQESFGMFRFTATHTPTTSASSAASGAGASSSSFGSSLSREFVPRVDGKRMVCMEEIELIESTPNTFASSTRSLKAGTYLKESFPVATDSTQLMIEVLTKPSLKASTPLVGALIVPDKYFKSYPSKEKTALFFSRKLSRSEDPRITKGEQMDSIFYNLSTFLNGIHHLGYIHGDFSESNILWDKSEPHVIDFEEGLSVKIPQDSPNAPYYPMIDWKDFVKTLISLTWGSEIIERNESTQRWLNLLKKPELEAASDLIWEREHLILGSEPLSLADRAILDDAFKTIQGILMSSYLE